MAPAKTSFWLGFVSRLSCFKSVYSRPFFMDHSMMRPSPEIETRVSALFSRWTHCISQIISVCLSGISFEEAKGRLFSVSFKLNIDMFPCESPQAIRWGYFFENWQHVMLWSVLMIRSGNFGFFKVQKHKRPGLRCLSSVQFMSNSP